MNKARNESKKSCTEMDIVIEVIDARVFLIAKKPYGCGATWTKPVIKILNKADLADLSAPKHGSII
jgi:ribosome biogenesis GTPase A